MHLRPKQLLTAAASAVVILVLLLGVPQTYLPYKQRAVINSASTEQHAGHHRPEEHTLAPSLKLPGSPGQQQKPRLAVDGAAGTSASSHQQGERRMPAALLVVDVQPCFLPGGALPTQGGHAIIPSINQLRQQGGFDVVVFTQDWHPEGHVSFAGTWQQAAEQRRHMEQGHHAAPAGAEHQREQDEGTRGEQEGAGHVLTVPATSLRPRDGGQGQEQLDQWTDNAGPQFQDKLQLVYTADGKLCNHTWLYPQHSVPCAAADLLELQDLLTRNSSSQDAASATPRGVHSVQQALWPDHCVQGTPQAQLHTDLVRRSTDVVLRKGSLPHLDAYSAFYDNGHVQATDLAAQLQQAGIQQVLVVGVATDYCVLFTALDAVKSGFHVVLVEEATAAVSAEGRACALKQLQQAGVAVVGTVTEALGMRHNTCSVASS